MSKRDVVVLGVARSAIGTFGGALADIEPCELTLVIMTNNANHRPIAKDVELVIQKFKAIDIVSADIAPSEDIYVLKNPPNPNKNILFRKHIRTHVPRYGNASGPNILFFSGMEYCRKFNTTLLLETDCIVKPTFVDKLSLFTKHSGGFLIAGTRYDGVLYSSPNTMGFFHINGVALYKTGSDELKELLEALDDYIVDAVKRETFVAYDYAMTQMILNRILNETIHTKWKRLYKQIITTNYIVNMSTNEDKPISVENVNRLYPNHVILHKKS
jgi:hypothetical protein